MTKAEFIESDIIEKYVLGIATDDEISLLNSMRRQYPEINEEIEGCEKSLMSYAKAHSKTPPPEVKQKLFDTINNQFSSSDEKEKIIPIQNSNTVLKFFAIAASILFIISLAINLNLFSKLKNANDQLAILQNQKEVLAQDIEYTKASFQKSEATLQAVSNKSTQVVILKGVAASPTSKAIVYWNTSTHTTHILISELPNPPKGKQYQLWALENGKPVDAGILMVSDTLQQVKNITVAQAFAITLEKAGGSAEPTLTSMYVLGTI